MGRSCGQAVTKRELPSSDDRQIRERLTLRGIWTTRVAMEHDRPKGYMTIRLAGLFFLLSALLELASINSEAPLFGVMRGGSVAVAYHVVYIAVFGGMGFGLWRAKTWGPSAIFAGTVLYSVDKFVCLIKDPILGYGALLSLFEPELVRMATTIVTLAVLVSWWGFVAYVYVRRAYFTD